MLGANDFRLRRFQPVEGGQGVFQYVGDEDIHQKLFVPSLCLHSPEDAIPITAHLDIAFDLLAFLIQAPATRIAGQHFVEAAGDASLLANPEQQIRDRNSAAVGADRPDLQ